jgi:predicted PurR-regulated permease PerM
MDPIVRALTKWKLPRPLAVIIVIAGFLGAVALLLWAIIPTAVTEAGKLINRIPTIVTNVVSNDLISAWDAQLGGNITAAADGALEFLTDTTNWPTLLGGVLQVGFGVLSGVVGVHHRRHSEHLLHGVA